MAALTITASSVVPASGSTVVNYKAGAAITPGQVVYYDATDATVKLCDVDLSSAASKGIGIAVGQAAAAGQYVGVCTAGPVAMGTILTAGELYVAGATAGALHPVADLVSTWRSTLIGYATSTSVLYVNPVASDTVHG